MIRNSRHSSYRNVHAYQEIFFDNGRSNNIAQGFRVWRITHACSRSRLRTCHWSVTGWSRPVAAKFGFSRVMRYYYSRESLPNPAWVTVTVPVAQLSARFYTSSAKKPSYGYLKSSPRSGHPGLQINLTLVAVRPLLRSRRGPTSRCPCLETVHIINRLRILRRARRARPARQNFFWQARLFGYVASNKLITLPTLMSLRTRTSPTCADALFNNLDYAGQGRKARIYGRVLLGRSSYAE
jgi:hypothetical protein